jgi:hypothetical protein
MTFAAQIVPECRLRLPQDFAADERASGPHWVNKRNALPEHIPFVKSRFKD